MGLTIATPEGESPRWILDDGPLDQLARLASASTLRHGNGGMLLVSSTTARSARSSSQRQRLLDVDCAGGGKLIETFSVRIGGSDPAAQIYFELHPDETSTTNRAEHESIAWAQVHGENAVFVTVDQRAALTALAELGRGRVAHPFDVWIDLLTREVITPGEFEELCRATRLKDQGLERLPTRVQEVRPGRWEAWP